MQLMMIERDSATVNSKISGAAIAALFLLQILLIFRVNANWDEFAELTTLYASKSGHKVVLLRRGLHYLLWLFKYLPVSSDALLWIHGYVFPDTLPSGESRFELKLASDYVINGDLPLCTIDGRHAETVMSLEAGEHALRCSGGRLKRILVGQRDPEEVIPQYVLPPHAITRFSVFRSGTYFRRDGLSFNDVDCRSTAGTAVDTILGGDGITLENVMYECKNESDRLVVISPLGKLYYNYPYYQR